MDVLGTEVPTPARGWSPWPEAAESGCAGQSLAEPRGSPGRRLTISRAVVQLAHKDGLAPDQLPSSAGTGHAQVAQLVASRPDQGRRHYRDSVGPTVCSSPGCDYEGVEEFFS